MKTSIFINTMEVHSDKFGNSCFLWLSLLPGMGQSV